VCSDGGMRRQHAHFMKEGGMAFCLRWIGGHRHSSTGKSADQVAGPSDRSGHSIGDHVPLALADQDAGDERRPGRPDPTAGGGVASVRASSSALPACEPSMVCNSFSLLRRVFTAVMASSHPWLAITRPSSCGSSFANHRRCPAPAFRPRSRW
jgi:hypothetical protein